MLLFLALWEWANTVYGDFMMPGPLQAAAELVDRMANGEAFHYALATAGRALLGFAAAALIGILAGTLAGASRGLGRLLEPVSTVLLGIPPIAWIVLAMLWFGSTLMTPVFTVVVTSIPITFAGAQIGMRTRDPGLDELARIYGLGPVARVRELYLPHLFSYLFPSLITAMGVAWKVTVMAELFAMETGIGAGLAQARVALDTAAAQAWMLLVVVLLLFMEHGMLRPLQRRLEPWRAGSGGRGMETV
ncbi:ABC transporter permease subunit [Halospina sp. K52047b]|uniref:ABC transporter permease n=1 Tax=Halospina sp. K52047b TaxID=2614160 RepID=UPI001CE44FF2|nr:ABC transporter permease subunit [Halospina sp. K52047b]